MPDQQCARCGRPSVSGARFCAFCGAPLVAEDELNATTSLFSIAELESRLGESGDLDAGQHQEAVRALPPGVGLLVVRRGPNAGSRFLLDRQRTSAGRHTDSEIFLDDVSVSRKHAEFHREATGYRVVDLGSLNGTYINGERVDSATLTSGDLVQIGKFRLTFLTS